MAKLSLFGSLLLAIGCVSLDKPPLVEDCAKKGTCSDDPNATVKKDAADAIAEPDLWSPDDTGDAKDDAGPGIAPDLAGDKADAGAGKQDVLGAEPTGPDVTAPGDRAEVVRNDVAGTDLDAGSEDVAGQDDVSKPEVVREDVLKEDVPNPEVGKDDLSAPEVGRDLGTDSLSDCKIYYGSGTQGHPPGPGSTGAFCIATCDDVAGWGCSNFDSTRKVTVNGTSVSCGGAVTKKNGYFVFEVSAGSDPNRKSAAIYWWGTWASTCTAPAGGF